MTAIFLAVTSSPARAAPARAGTAAGVFLRLARTARAGLLGNCGTGAVGPSALGRNPAALGERPGLAASRNQATGGEISVDHVAAARRFGRRSAGGISVLHVSGGGIDQTDDNGQRVGGFTPRDIAATLGGSRFWGPFSAGFTVSFLHSKIIHTAHAVTTGAGAQWQSSDLRTRAGLYASNISGRLRYVNAKEPLPREVRAGIRREFRRAGVVLEGAYPRDNAAYVAGGVELNFQREAWGFALRTGFDGARARSRSGAGGVGAGAGISTGRWSLDYAWSPGGDIGDDHLFTLGMRFKPSVASVPKAGSPQ